MSVHLTAKQREALVELMENPGIENPSPEQVADLIWKWCSNAWNDRAKYAVVGQQLRDGRGRRLPRGGEKLVLGFFSTPGAAKDAARALRFSTQSAEEYAVWTMPIVHKAAGTYFQERARIFKDAMADAEKRERLIAACRMHVLADIAAHAHSEKYAQWRWAEFYEAFPEAKPEEGS